jgi:hypothetical protein
MYHSDISVCNGEDVKVKEAYEVTCFNVFIYKYGGEIQTFWVSQSFISTGRGGGPKFVFMRHEYLGQIDVQISKVKPKICSFYIQFIMN